jgi:acetyl-CoA acetyltransferase
MENKEECRKWLHSVRITHLSAVSLNRYCASGLEANQAAAMIKADGLS